MGLSEVRNLKVWAVLLMAALALVLLVGVLLAKPAHAKTFTVNSTADTGDATPDGTCNTCTLREAIQEANPNGESDTIGFASGLGGEIDLSAEAGGFFIQNDTPAVDVRIKGPRGGLTIDGHGQAQVFVIQAPTSDPSDAANAAIEGLTIKNGFAPGTPSIGGGIYNGGTLRLTNSTVSGNHAGAAGGGILNAGTGTLRLTNSTVSGNHANNNGGGIWNGGDATLVNTIVAGNSAPTNPDAQGGFTSQGHNLIGNTEGSSGWVDSDLQDVDPLLGPLQNNGGTTDTHALLPGSPAIDSGTNTGCPATDQRGVARPNDGDKNGTAICDIGSFEVDTTAPKVSAVTPTGPGIGRGANVVATFSEKMRPASITKSTFRLFKVTSSGTTQVTNVTVTPSSDGLKATLNPYGTSSTLLAARTKYKAVVTTGGRDLASNALDQSSTTAGNQQKAWTFTTKG